MHHDPSAMSSPHFLLGLPTLLFPFLIAIRSAPTTEIAHIVCHFYHTSICEGGLGSRNSVCPSVCVSHAWIVTKLNDALQIFYTTRKGNYSTTLIPTVVGGRRPLPSEICTHSDPPPSKNADFGTFPLITSQP